LPRPGIWVLCVAVRSKCSERSPRRVDTLDRHITLHFGRCHGWIGWIYRATLQPAQPAWSDFRSYSRQRPGVHRDPRTCPEKLGRQLSYLVPDRRHWSRRHPAIGFLFLSKSIGRVDIRPSKIGKAATLLQITSILWLLLGIARVGQIYLIALATLFTVASGLGYVADGLRQAREASHANRSI